MLIKACSGGGKVWSNAYCFIYGSIIFYIILKYMSNNHVNIRYICCEYMVLLLFAWVNVFIVCVENEPCLSKVMKRL